MNQKTLNDVFDMWMSNHGIFDYLDELDVPWKDSIEPAQLNMQYHGNHSGNKPIAPLVEHLLNSEGTMLISNKQKLAAIIFNLNKHSWNKLWTTLTLEYNPIENYNMIESEISSNNSGTEGKTTDSGTVTVDGTDTGTIQNDAESSSENSGSVYGFNSVEASPTDTTSTSADSGNTETRDLANSSTETRDLENNIQSNTKSNGFRTLTRSGNIGTTTSQQMVQAERELYELWKFFNVVFRDIDNVLCLSIYN